MSTSGGFFRPLAKLAFGALLGLISSIVLAYLAPTPPGPPTFRMGIVERWPYLSLLLQHFLLTALLFALIIPLVIPRWCARPAQALRTGGTVGVGLLVVLTVRLGLESMQIDHPFVKTFIEGVVGTIGLLVVSFFVGIEGNPIVTRRAEQRPPDQVSAKAEGEAQL